MSVMTDNDWYYHFKNGIPVGTNYGRGKWCYDCNFGHTPDECGSKPNKEDPMYQICLVIKENLREEVSSMLVSGHESLDEAAEQILIDFERLQDANELSAKVDEMLLALHDASGEHPHVTKAFITIIKSFME